MLAAAASVCCCRGFSPAVPFINAVARAAVQRGHVGAAAVARTAAHSRHTASPPYAARTIHTMSAAEQPAAPAEGALSGKEKRALRALAGALKAESRLCTLQLGASLASAAFVAQLRDSLRAFELVNVRSRTLAKKAECKELASSLAAETESEIVQVVGHTILLYRRRRRGEEAGRDSVDIEKQLRVREARAREAAARNGLQF
ncbi:hypothetical protein JKP88DRAFT_231177 [Tribonema minus]|uniref:CRM domain-containing protein n=1 Tax=Tribonema minus TaxID=303371 RepID=A0A835ZBT6_9STRA|nr:hypothetical protein JKP88DRAFT_231177 [Tribonema minus]